MPSYSFLNDPDADQVRQITALYRAEGWWDGGDEDAGVVGRIVSGSYCFAIAVDEGEIVGMGRAISDGVSDAYIQDVAVRDSLRGKGIGSRLIRELAGRLERDGMNWIGLIAERGSSGFYSRLGFEVMPDSAPMVKKTPWR
ncbi:GNAT family N-acetyltransferase [Elusimicrobiota bacterium]